jgi:hypothetical protein
MSFKKDLEFGRYFEIEFMKHIEHDRFEQAPDDQKFSEYDLKVFHNDKITTYEIKADKQALNGTNNLCIEYENRNGGKSGISASRADYYIFMCLDPISGYTIYKIPRKELIKMINRQEFDKKIIVRDSGNKCVLFNLNKFKKYLYKVIY